MATRESGTRLCLFIPSFGDGGVERMLVNLASGMVHHGVEVDFVVRQAAGPHLALLPPQVRLLELGTAHGLQALLATVRYLRADRPHVLLSAKGSDDRLALRAKRWAGVPVRNVLITGTSLSGRMEARRRSRLYRWRKGRSLRRMYAKVDGVIAVSRGVADDLGRVTGLPDECIQVVPNPVVTPEIEPLANERPLHPWLARKEVPVVLGVGGLRRQKDFKTLLQAFAAVRRQLACRLIILGEGRQRDRLEALGRALGIRNDLSLPGFQPNPYAYMAAADLFVLSSRWEGFGAVIVEALALGLPVVSTDCPTGPREILEDGRFGRLVPVGDSAAMARAMIETLADPPPSDLLRTAVRRYTLEASSQAYLLALGLTGAGEPLPSPGVHHSRAAPPLR
jgi:glycosyltransferase involved in cell wall biosynthesis